MTDWEPGGIALRGQWYLYEVRNTCVAIRTILRKRAHRGRIPATCGKTRQGNTTDRDGGWDSFCW